MADEPPKNRGQMAIKSKLLTPEWQTMVRKAAERTNVGIGDFIVQTCQDRAMQILTGKVEEGIPASIPARIEDVRDIVAERLAEAVAQIGEALKAEQAEIRADVEAQRQQTAAEIGNVMRLERENVAKMVSTMRRGRWRK